MLFTGHSFGVIGNVICGQENSGGKSILLEYREGDEIKVPEPVIEGDNNVRGVFITLIAGAINKFYGMRKAYNIVIILFEEPHLSVEAFRGGVDPEVGMRFSLRLIAHTMVHENGYGYITTTVSPSSG